MRRTSFEPGQTFFDLAFPDLADAVSAKVITRQEAINTAYARMLTWAKSVLLRRRNYTTSAVEIVHIAIVRILDGRIGCGFSAEKGDGTGFLRGAIRRIVGELSRKRQSNAIDFDNVLAPGGNPLDHAIRSEQIELLNDVWPELTKAQQLAITRRFGAVFNTPPSDEAKTENDYVHRHRGLRRLKKLLEDRGVEG
jgi:hypothetical protein